MTEEKHKTVQRAKRQAKREANGLRKRKEGSLKSEMEHRIRERAKNPRTQLTHHYRDNAIRACCQFDQWRKSAGWSNKQVREQRKAAVEAWVHSLQQPISEENSNILTLRHKKAPYSPASIHTMVAGVCLGLGIDMTGICRTGTALDKTKSSELSKRAERAEEKECNQDIIRFAQLVGGRRTAYTRLTGADFLQDESGEYCVRFVHDKGKKTQYQRIAPEHIAEVYAYFDGRKSDEKIFPNKLDRNLDLHGIRAEHARSEYERYAQICSTPAGRQKMQQQLWKRFYDPRIGNKAWLTAMKNGEYRKAQKLEKAFAGEMKNGIYWLLGNNRQAALLKDRPIGYDRLALCCVSVFSLSHWRNEVTVKHYMI